MAVAGTQTNRSSDEWRQRSRARSRHRHDTCTKQRTHTTSLAISQSTYSIVSNCSSRTTCKPTTPLRSRTRKDSKNASMKTHRSDDSEEAIRREDEREQQ